MFKKLRSPVAVCDVITQNDIAPMPELDSWISGAGIVFPALGWRFCRAVSEFVDNFDLSCCDGDGFNRGRVLSGGSDK